MSKSGKKILKGAKEALAWTKNYAPGTYGWHEALHMASFFVDAVDTSLIEHPSIKARPDLRKLAEDAQEKLYELYQAIGREHL